MSTITRDMKICDDCELVPYDMRIGVVHEWDYEDLDEFDAAHARGLKEQIAFMVEMGNVMADHACSLNTEPELYEEYGIMCDCACNPRRFEQQRDWAKKQREKEE